MNTTIHARIESAADSPRFGDALPPPPEDRTAPEVIAARRGLGNTLRRMWLRLSHRRPVPMLPARDHVRRIVAVHPGRLAELVFAEPALSALRRRFHKMERVLYAIEGAEELFAGTGWGEVRPLAELAREKHERVRGRISVDFTRAHEYTTARLLAHAGIETRAGFEIGGRRAYLTIPFTFPRIDEHPVESCLSLAESLGAEVHSRVPSLPHGPDRYERGRNRWKQLGLTAPIVLLPGWDGDAFGWPEDRFVAVARTLHRTPLAVITGPGDEQRGRRVSEHLDVPWIDAPPISELIDLLAAGSLAIGNDGGALHLAAALARPVVALMVNPHAWRRWPRSEAGAIVFRAQDETGAARFDRVPDSDIAAAALHLKV
ncbi:MAG: hypothetical protein MAG453_00319 [Calditrichaeota bacterium]|nr:hypothetical protein [Calditrichota bacterium]